MAETLSLNPLDIKLDFENPRFSMFNFENEKEIIEYLIKYEQIKSLAFQIAENGYVTLGERLIILKDESRKEGFYTVLEGNRRIGALKLIFQYKFLLSSAERSKLEAQKLEVENYRVECDVVGIEEKEEALFKISAKHVEGIKNWSATDKRVFYLNLYNQYIQSGISKNIALEKIIKVTPENKNSITKSIKELLFLQKVHSATKFNNPNLDELAHLDTDVMISRVLRPLTKTLELKQDDNFNFISKNEKLYKAILSLIGEAVWITKKLNTRTFNKQNEWGNILENDQLIPGLKKKVELYFSKDIEELIKITGKKEYNLGSFSSEKSKSDINDDEPVTDSSYPKNRNDFKQAKNKNSDGIDKYKLFIRDRTKTITNKGYDLSKNIELHDMYGQVVSKNSSEYLKVKTLSFEDGISINNNKINNISSNGHYKILVKYEDKEDSFDLILNAVIQNTQGIREKSLFDSLWYNDSLSKLSAKVEYRKICSTIRNLNEVNVLTDNEDSYIVMAFLTRMTIEYISKAYWDKFLRNSYPESLPNLVGQLKGRLYDKGLINKTESKTIGKAEDLEKLNGEIHDYKTAISTFDVRSIFFKYKNFLTILIDEITR